MSRFLGLISSAALDLVFSGLCGFLGLILLFDSFVEWLCGLIVWFDCWFDWIMVIVAGGFVVVFWLL